MHDGMKIIDKADAAELFDKGEAVYLLYDDDTESLVTWSKAEIYLHTRGVRVRGKANLAGRGAKKG